MDYTLAIPVYNGAHGVCAALDSCLAQNAPFPFEVLLVDNASTDATPEVVRPYADRVRLIRNARTVTMYENHNECLRHAAGRHVLFCHADDALEPNALTVVDRALKSVPAPDQTVLWGRSLFRDFFRMLEISGLALNQVFSGPAGIKPFLYGGLTPSGTCFPRQALLDVGGFVYTAHPLCPNDWMTMMLLALRNFSFVMIDQRYVSRKFSTTLPGDVPLARRLDAWAGAIRDLRHVLSDEELMTALSHAFSLRFPPLPFYYACIKNHLARSVIKRRLAFKVGCNPLLWRDPLTIRTLLA